MHAKGITGATADDIWQKIKSFASFGFSESHSISFAFLPIASSRLKLYYPAAFLAALLNAQPMGFYNPQTLVHDARRHDARRHGIDIRGVDITATMAYASLEPTTTHDYTGPGPHQPAVRLGLSSVRTISDDLDETISAERGDRGPYRDMPDLARRVRLTTPQIEALATAGAFTSLGLTRRAGWP